MLADSYNSRLPFGVLSVGVQKRGTSLHALLDFIAEQLPIWRDRADRPHVTAETHLTSQLAAHLTGAARHSEGWDFLQFRNEVPDETESSRSIDLVPSTCGETVWVEGRLCSEFDTLLPIECKRLPTPKGAQRDPREYVTSKHSTTGGIQRFKAGNHGGQHSLAAMIGYVQVGTAASWLTQVSMWIDDLVKTRQVGWASTDDLKVASDDTKMGLAIYNSAHSRNRALCDIRLRHMWIVMH